MLARTMPTPVRASTVVTIGMARSPAVNTCAAATIVAKSTALMRLRVTSRTPIPAGALDRRTARSDPQAVHGDVGGTEASADGIVELLDRDREDPVVRSAQREERAREVRPEHRRDAHERRAPRKAAALAQEHRFGRMGCIRSETGEDLEAP